MKTLTRALVIAALSVPVAASAQDAPGEGAKPSGPPKTAAPDAPAKEKQKLAESDLAIIAQYHHENLLEMDLGKAASKRAVRPEVKAYGEMMVRDHASLEKQMMGLARKTGQAPAAVKIKDAAAGAHIAKARQRAAEISKLEGASFDRAYLDFMVEDHSHVLANIDAHIAAAQHPELAEMLRKARPILQQHRERARELQQNEPQAVR